MTRFAYRDERGLRASIGRRQPETTCSTRPPMRERPILMSAPMVCACLREVDPKTQTRRVVKPQPDWLPEVGSTRRTDGLFWPIGSLGQQCGSPLTKCPYGVAGDRLWVREGLRRSEVGPWLYAADDEPIEMDRGDQRVPEMVAWAHHKQGDRAPSIHMPRWACRLVLRITDVRVERLQDISEADAMAEGLTCAPEPIGPPERPMVDVYRWEGGHEVGYVRAVAAYRALWKHIHGPGSWDLNPWVWAVAFERVEAA